MRATQFRYRSASPSIFASPKCKAAIPVRDVLLRDALQQASLEPSVRAICYRKVAELSDPQIPLTGIILDRVDGNFLLLVCATLPQRTAEQLARLTGALERYGLVLLERDARDVKREPLFSNVRAVWSYHRYHVSLKDRLKIAAALADEGPQSILELEDRARPTCDILAAVCALACENFVKLNIDDTPLSPRTIVLGR